MPTGRRVKRLSYFIGINGSYNANVFKHCAKPKSFAKQFMKFEEVDFVSTVLCS